MKNAKLTGLVVAVFLTVGNAAAAKPPLREVVYVDNGLYQIALANVIRKGCSEIDARLFKAIGALRAIKNHAISLGYSDAEINAYVESDVEKDRLRARGARLFEARNVDPENPADLCRLGREEIANNSPVGQLLRAK